MGKFWNSKLRMMKTTLQSEKHQSETNVSHDSYKRDNSGFVQFYFVLSLLKIERKCCVLYCNTCSQQKILNGVALAGHTIAYENNILMLKLILWDYFTKFLRTPLKCWDLVFPERRVLSEFCTCPIFWRRSQCLQLHYCSFYDVSTQFTAVKLLFANNVRIEWVYHH